MTDPYDGLGPPDATAADTSSDINALDAATDALDASTCGTQTCLLGAACNTDSGNCEAVYVASSIAAIAVYLDTLFTLSFSGAIATCTYPCSGLTPLVAAANPTFDGFAVSKTNIYWTIASGIEMADLDGGNDHLGVTDSFPKALAVDGNRIYWTTLGDAGAAIRTCADPSGTGCNDGGVGNLVPTTSNVSSSTQLAAAGKQVEWVANSNSVNVTSLDGATVTYDPSTDLAGLKSDKTFVASGATKLAWAIHTPNLLVIRACDAPCNGDIDASSLVYRQPLNITGLFVGGGIVFWTSSNAVHYEPITSTDGGVTTLDPTPVSAFSAVAATSSMVFLLDNHNDLYRLQK